MLNKAKKRLSLTLGVLVRGRQAPQSRFDIPPISPEEVAEAKEFFPREKFFILGHARSGTTLLARLVRLHPEVHCNYQAHFFTRPPLLQSLVADAEVKKWLTRSSNRWNRGRDLSPVVLRAVSDFILERDAQRVGKPIVGDKSPSSLLDGKAVHLMHNIYPDARLIYIVRDGRDTAISHRFQGFIDAPQRLSKEDLRIRAEFSHNAEPFMHGERSVFTEKGIRQAAEGWVKNVVETDLAGKELYDSRYISLRYEDLLACPWEEMSRLWNFLSAVPGEATLEDVVMAEFQQNPDADWQQQKAGEIANSLQKGKHGSWREMFTPRDRQIFHEIAGETLNQWGYKE
jgi:hypothetical protein